MLSVRDLCSGYGTGTVLDGLSLEVGRGEALAVLGRNGVGKTTLLHTLMGLVPARRGSISLDGVELADRRPDQISRAGMALVPQGRRIWPSVSVHEHLVLAHRRGAWSIDRLYDLFARLRERRSHAAGLLSGGEQQMLAVARALATNPTLMLLDEPSEGLAPTLVAHLGAAIRETVQNGLTLLVVEHNLKLAFTLAERVVVMARGTVAHSAATAAFQEDRETAHQLLGVAA